MTKPRTAPSGGKPDQRPEHNHAVLSQAEQARHLGVADETVLNLGHSVRESELTRHPLDRVHDYTNHASERVVRGPARSQGVYGKFRDPQSGIPTNEQNLDRWASYAKSNSYHGGDGTGVEPTMRDPRGGRDEGSDGHLVPLPNPSTANWADFRAGSESGEGRLEKLHKR